MVKFPRQAIAQLVERHWDKEGDAPIVFYVGKGALHWLISCGEFFVATDEVHGLTPETAQNGKIEEQFFLMNVPRLIQTKIEAITVQLMTDEELIRVHEKLSLLCINNPTFAPYDRECEVCEIEMNHRKALLASTTKAPKVRRVKPNAIVPPGAQD